MRTCTLGVDIGSTYVKALAVAADGTTLATERRRTPWYSPSHGLTEMDADALAATVGDLLAAVAAALEGVRVTGIGISGMAEAGVLLDGDDRVVRPVVAWFDPRGGEEMAGLPAALRAAFPGRTGLPVTPLATVAKLLHLRAGGLALDGLCWLNVPEYVALLLGGARRRELSLAARTGLLDQDSAQPWPEVFDALGVGTGLLPPPATAGSVWGEASGRLVPPALSGAVVTVAGHDHLVASVAAGVLDTDVLYDSMGTAEALVRVLDDPLDPPARERLAGHGVNVVRHLLPGRSTMLVGTRGGLVLRRVLALVGVQDDTGRAALDEAVLALAADGGPAAVAIRVEGAWNHQDTLAVYAGADEVSPAALFAAALAHGTEVLTEVVARMETEVEPAVRTVVSGGWTGMACVRQARAAALPDVSFSAHAEDTAVGAALVGAYAAADGVEDLAAYAADVTSARRATRPPAS